MIRTALVFLFVFTASIAYAQMDGAMVMQGATQETEKPLTMAGGFEKAEQDIQAGKQAKQNDFDFILFEQIRKIGIYKNPLVVKKMYTYYTSIENSVREEHAQRLEKISKDDKQAYEKEKRRLDAQTPIRFQPFEDSEEEINAFINKNPELAMYLIIKNVSTPDYDHMTPEEQKEYINRAKARYKLHAGYSPEEYLQKYVESKIQKDEKSLKGQTLMDDSAFQGDDYGEKSKEKK